MPDLRSRFAAELRVARTQAGLTQEQLAAAADTSPDYLSKLERGLNSPSLETLAALVKVLGLDLTAVLAIPLQERRASPARVELEARAASIARSLDDRSLTALLEIADTLQRLSAKPDKGSRSAPRSGAK